MVSLLVKGKIGFRGPENPGKSVKQGIQKYNLFYYIDTNILLENIPLIKFIKATFGTRVVYFP